MDDIDGLDRLNALVLFGPDAEILKAEEGAVRSVLGAMPNRALSEELARCFDAGSFADNGLVCKDNRALNAGEFIALMTTPYLRDDCDRQIVSLQGFRYRDVVIPDPLRTAYPAPKARPVDLLKATQGIRSSPRFVVCFSESLLGRAPSHTPHEFYFCDKLADVFFQSILPLVLRLWDCGSFAALRAATQDDIKQAIAIWVHLHEHFQSATPEPASRYAAGGIRLSRAFQELRVDLRVMLAGIASYVGARLARITVETILAFRLIYYGSSFDPEQSFDAVISVALSNILSDAGCLSMTSACQYAFSSDAALRQGLELGLQHLCTAEDRIADRLQPGAEDGRGQADLRRQLEEVMRDLCRAPENSRIERGPFHKTHSGSLLGDDLEQVV